MAIGVLEVFAKNTSEAVDDVLIIRYIRQLDIDHLELAYICNCKKFISNSLVQRVLDKIWKGKKRIKDDNVNNY
jgi:succinate dehydrogenase flavin-adding protein (antitoxin of CptAB toxin-antitoxin module)